MKYKQEPIQEEQDSYWDPTLRCEVEKYTLVPYPSIQIDWVGPVPVYSTPEFKMKTAESERIYARMREEIEELRGKLRQARTRIK